MDSFDGLWSELAPIGRHAGTGGYRRFAFDPAELACREWFVATAQARGLDVETDRNSNIWAWWVPPGVDPHLPALVLGSHLDSVPDGGAYDGPLGVVSAFAALDAVRDAGLVPDRPVVLVAFADEEGARFGIACAGSRLMTGQLDPDKARALVGRDGRTMAEAMTAEGFDPTALGPDPERIARIGEFVELHVEQGRNLVDQEAAVGVAESIWPHGRYRLTFHGVADHAGTTRMQDRKDPMVAYAHAALAADAAARASDSRATFGRIEVEPNGTNAVPSTVRAWLDARAADQPTLEALVARIAEAAGRRGEQRRHHRRASTPSRPPPCCRSTCRCAIASSTSSRDPVREKRSPCYRPRPGTTRGSSRQPACARRCSSCATRPASRTRRTSSPSPTDCHAGVAALAAVLTDLAR